MPVVTPFISHPALTLGVVGNAFTLEVYLHPWATQRPEGAPGYPTLNGVQEQLELLLFFSPIGVRSEAATALDGLHPAALVSSMYQRAHAARILDERDWFMPDGEKTSSVYFNRYVVVPIFMVCSDQDVTGYLVLTSEQEEPFADDCQDTLRFLASLITNYTAAFNDCVSDHLEAAKAKSE